MIDEPRARASSVWCRRLSLAAVALILAAAVFHRLFGMPTPVALNLFKLGFALTALACVLGVVALVGVWKHGGAGTASAVTGLVLGGLVLCWPLSLIPTARSLPPIHDVTTDVETPPQFRVLAAMRPKGANSAAYGGPEIARQQTEYYRELQPLVLARSPADAFEFAAQALRKLRMVIVSEVPSDQGGVIEAYDRTLVLGFYDDVVVRVRRQGAGARIDVRSESRFGTHDLGRNAQRVRDILNEIVARADASVPGQRRPRRRSRGHAG